MASRGPRERSRSPRRTGNAVQSSKLEILRAILAAARNPELSVNQLHDFISCAGNLPACPANPKTGCENGTIDFISRDELQPEECVALPSSGEKPNCVNISTLGHSWGNSHVTVDPFTRKYLTGSGCSVEGRDRPRNLYDHSDNPNMNDDHEEEILNMRTPEVRRPLMPERNTFAPFVRPRPSGPRPAARPAPVSPTATPEQRRRAALQHRSAALEHQAWVEEHLGHLEDLTDNGTTFHVGDENWMAQVRYQQEEREIDEEISRLDREIRDDEGLEREDDRHQHRTDYPRLRDHQRKLAAIKNELVEHITRMQTMRNLPLSFMQRAREWVAGRQRYLESLKRKLSEAEAEEQRLFRTAPH